MGMDPGASAHDSTSGRRTGRRRPAKGAAALALLGATGLVVSGLAGADGTESLGPPAGVTLASGTGIAVGGVGLGGATVANGGTGVPNQAGTFSVAVPAGATVKQVLLYWEGHSYEGTALDDTVTLNATPVAGTLIGGPRVFFANVAAATHRADVTGLGLVGPGTTSLTVAGLDDSYANDGAGVVVVYDAGGTAATIGVRDGLDLAYANFLPPLDTTVAQTFTFAASTVARTATLGVLAGSIEGAGNTVRVVTGGVTTDLVDQLADHQGNHFDARSFAVTVPAGATSLSVQALSGGAVQPPASFAWVVGTLSVPPARSGPGTGTPGYWKNHPEAWPVSSLALGATTYTKAQLLDILGQAKSRDMTYALASQLIAAKLNVANGTAAGCITATITAADAWLAAHPVGSGVTADSAAWKTGEPLKSTLDAYNNGLLCAPHRD